ncbi:hypothetical protein NDU88_007907 [Pleurodeles waltl]|uniref:Uncharacterized protein n=1 Tax=Pleurodeles waltl TaxID=8319 RepID=A0AAV7SU37_PLEWA|nr:hypothetical protein NDU88_007907 [Pleurodeles waltl]
MLSQSHLMHWETPLYHPMKLNQLHTFSWRPSLEHYEQISLHLNKTLQKEIKGLTKDMSELVDNLERASDAQEEELDGHQREILELQDKNEELRYQVEDLENQSWRANIQIKGVLLQAARGDLEDYTR